jgi:hypothetical protein
VISLLTGSISDCFYESMLARRGDPKITASTRRMTGSDGSNTLKGDLPFAPSQDRNQSFDPLVKCRQLLGMSFPAPLYGVNNSRDKGEFKVTRWPRPVNRPARQNKSRFAQDANGAPEIGPVEVV